MLKYVDSGYANYSFDVLQDDTTNEYYVIENGIMYDVEKVDYKYSDFPTEKSGYDIIGNPPYDHYLRHLLFIALEEFEDLNGNSKEQLISELMDEFKDDENLLVNKKIIKDALYQFIHMKR